MMIRRARGLVLLGNRSYSSQKFNMDPTFILSTGLNQLLNMHASPSPSQYQKSQYTRHEKNSFSMSISPNEFYPGSLTTLADTTIGIGAILHLPADSNRMALVELNIHYLIPDDHYLGSVKSDTSRIECVATPLHKGKSMQVWESVCKIADNTLCVVRGTVLNLYPKENAQTGYDNVKRDFNMKEVISSDKQQEIRRYILELNSRYLSQKSDISSQICDKLMNILHTGVSGLLNIEIADLDTKARVIKTRMLIDEKHMAGTGMVHGGAINSFSETSLRLCATLFGFDFLRSSNIHFVSSTATIGDEFTCEIRLTQVDTDNIILDATISHSLSKQNVQSDSNKITAFARGTASRLTVNQKQPDQYDANAKRLEKLGTGFNVSTMTKKEIQEKFDKHSENWIKWTTQFKYFPVFEWIQKNCEGLPAHTKLHGKVFDMATGVGLVAQALRRNGVQGRIMGLDISPGMINKAKATECYSQLMIHDLDDDVPFTGEFDLVTCCGATEMLSDLSHFMVQVKKVLRKGGEAWITFQFKHSESSNPLKHQGMKDYTIEEVHQLFASHGFTVISSEVAPEAYFLPSPEERGKLLAVPFLMVRAVLV